MNLIANLRYHSGYHLVHLIKGVNFAKLLDLNATFYCSFCEIISNKINYHNIFTTLFNIGSKFLLEFLILWPIFRTTRDVD